MHLSWSRISVIAPALALVFIGVASVAFSWGATNGGSQGAPAGPMAASPGAVGPAASARGIPRAGAGGPGSVIGTVASKTASAIVVTTVAGQSVTVNVSPATTYSVRGVTGATIDNIAVGSQIVVQGTPNADGSVNATRIQSGVRGFGGGGRSRGGGFGGPTPAPSATASGLGT
jgi:hypothetical protein